MAKKFFSFERAFQITNIACYGSCLIHEIFRLKDTRSPPSWIFNNIHDTSQAGSRDIELVTSSYQNEGNKICQMFTNSWQCKCFLFCSYHLLDIFKRNMFHLFYVVPGLTGTGALPVLVYGDPCILTVKFILVNTIIPGLEA